MDAFADQARNLAERYEREAREEEDRKLMGVGSDEEEEEVDRMEIFGPVVQTLVGALGGYEDVIDPETGQLESRYRPGDSVLAVLKDLKKLWRKDDTDDERTVFRCFAESGLCSELIALLEECTGRGEYGRKIALAAADLLAALTWPIDVQQELRDMLDDGEVAVSDYATLLRKQVEFKALMLRTGQTFHSLMMLAIPSLALSGRDRTEKDKRIISLMLHLIRNLLAIRDPIGTGFGSGDTMELGSMQSRLIVQLQEAQFLSLLVTLGQNVERTEFEEYNVLVLDCLWLIFRGLEPEDLMKESQEVAAQGLAKLLEAEDRALQKAKRAGTSRHSRFGTTIQMKAAGERYTLHKQSSISTSAGSVLDGTKRKRAAPATKQDELSGRRHAGTDLNAEAIDVVKELAKSFLGCFDTFMHSVLKDIRMGRTKIRVTDNLRVLYLGRFYMEYFMLLRQKEADTKAKKVREAELAKKRAERSGNAVRNIMDDDDLMRGLEDDGSVRGVAFDGAEEAAQEPEMDFRILAEVFQDDTRIWLGKRLNEAKEATPRGDVEIQACLDFFTQLLVVIAAMAKDKDEEILDLADTLSAKLLQNAEFIETAYACLKTYKQQSIAYLDSAVSFCYTLIKTLEQYTKDRGHLLVRKKRAAKRINLAVAEDAQLDEEEEQAAALEKATATYTDHQRKFKDFERALADERIVSTLLRYLSRYREFPDENKLKRLVSLMHRIAVGVEAEAFFFKVSGFEIFKQILDDQRSLPPGQASKDLVACINFILRRFFKALQSNPLLAVEAFWPKPKGKLRKMTASDTEEEDSDGGPRLPKVPKIPADFEFKPEKQLTWSQKVGVAVRCLTDDRKVHLIMWLNELLGYVSTVRRDIILSVDGEPRVYDPDLDDERPPIGPSAEAKQRLLDHDVKYDTEEQEQATTYNPHLRLLMTLTKLEVKENDEVPKAGPSNHMLRWHLPKSILPDDLDASVRIIKQFILEPLDLDGSNPADVLKRKRKTAVRKRRALSDGEERPRVARKKKQAEVQQYKSAAFIEDSDEDPEADAEFFAREAALREANRTKIARGQPSLDNTARKQAKVSRNGKRREAQNAGSVGSEEEHSSQELSSDVEGSDRPSRAARPQRSVPQRKRPAPRRKKQPRGDIHSSDGEVSSFGADHAMEADETVPELAGDSELGESERQQLGSRRPGKRVVAVSDEED